jgi:hypothetical protein
MKNKLIYLNIVFVILSVLTVLGFYFDSGPNEEKKLLEVQFYRAFFNIV